MTHDERCQRSAYQAHAKEGSLVNLTNRTDKPEDWKLLGVFRTSHEASKWLQKLHPNGSGTVTPLDFPDPLNAYWQRYRMCPECDHNPMEKAGEKDMWLVQVRHADDQWHFGALLSQQKHALMFQHGCADPEDNRTRFIPIRLPESKHTFTHRGLVKDIQEMEKEWFWDHQTRPKLTKWINKQKKKGETRKTEHWVVRWGIPAVLLLQLATTVSGVAWAMGLLDGPYF